MTILRTKTGTRVETGPNSVLVEIRISPHPETRHRFDQAELRDFIAILNQVAYDVWPETWPEPEPYNIYACRE